MAQQVVKQACNGYVGLLSLYML